MYFNYSQFNNSLRMRESNRENNIISSIQKLKIQLKYDKQKLQQIQNDFQKGKSQVKISNLKQNQDNISNLKENNGDFINFNVEQKKLLRRNSKTKENTQNIEIKKNHHKQIKQLIKKHQYQMNQQKQEFIKKIQRINSDHAIIVQQKDSYIQMLESALKIEKSDQTQISFQINDIKEHYQNQLIRMKQQYQTIINHLTEQNQQSNMKIHQLETIIKMYQIQLRKKQQFKQDFVKITESQNCSMNEDLYNQSVNPNQLIQQSVIFQNSAVEEGTLLRQSNKISHIFKQKFKFKKFNKKKPTFNNLYSISHNSFKKISQEKSQVDINQIFNHQLSNSEDVNNWDDQEINDEQNFLRTIKNIKASLIN